MVLYIYACLYKLNSKIHNGTPNSRPIKSSHISKNSTSLNLGQFDLKTFQFQLKFQLLH